MHPSLSYHVTPPDQRPFVPTRTHAVGVRFELGQIQPEPVPPMPYAPLPNGGFFDSTLRPAPRPAVVCSDVARGPGCGRTFYPQRTTAQRCPTCRDVRWHGPSPAVAKSLATKAVNQATRDRAQRARQRSAA